MFKHGVVSVSFRKNSPEEILSAVKHAGLSVIEWGGDVHSPSGDVEKAKEIAELSKKYGIELVSYGSYFRLCKNTKEEFSGVIKSALALGTKIVRIWACGNIPEMSGEKWDFAVNEARTLAEMAEKSGITLCLECHNDSITEDYHSALAFLSSVNHPSLRLYWQINEFKDKEYNLAAARAMAPYVECIHAFYYIPGRIQVPIENGFFDWQDYLSIFREIVEEKTIPVYLEFMPDGKMESLSVEGATLKKLILSLD